MNKVYVCSDLHFRHNKDFLINPRGFETVEAHDEAIVERWNSIVHDEDTVYVLGDLMLGGEDNEKAMSYLRQLKGQIKVVCGNHDTTNRIKLYKTLDNVEILGFAYVIKYKKYIFYISHYPTLTSNQDEDKPLRARVINLCGHTHTNDKFYHWDKGLIYHVDMDAHDCRPVDLDVVIEEIRERIQQDEDKKSAEIPFYPTAEPTPATLFSKIKNIFKRRK